MKDKNTIKSGMLQQDGKHEDELVQTTLLPKDPLVMYQIWMK